MKTALVLGGTQFFGKRLVNLLIENGIDVTIATRGKTKDSFGDRVKRLIIDRQDAQSMLTAFEHQSWDVVFDQSCFSPIEAKDTLNALKGKVSKYIFTSTMAVYDFGTNHKEEGFDPNSFTFDYKLRTDYPGYVGYQEAKRAAEAVLYQDGEVDVVAVRFPIVIGEDDYTNRLQFHVEKVLNGETIGFSDANAKYSYILSVEAAQFLMNIAKSDYVGPINPGCEGDMSLQELVNMISEKTGKPALVTNELTKENASPYSLPGSWSINTDRVQSLGFTFSPLHETINRLIEFYHKA